MQTILFLEWKSFGNAHMKQAFEKAGFTVDMQPFNEGDEDTRMSENLAAQLVSIIMSKKYEFVFSFNYYPVVAIACQACRVRYVSWIYDSPFIQMYSQTITFDTNYVFIFDKGTYLDLKGRGVNTVYYLPMAAAVEYYDTKSPSEEIKKQFGADVTFVGAMYNEKRNNLYRHLENLDEYTKGYLEAVMQAQKRIYGYNFLEKVLSKEIMDNVTKVCPLHEQGDGFETLEWTFANYFLARKITAMERMDIMKRLQERYEVHLFTNEKTPMLPKVKNWGRVDYYEQMPFIFKCGKIHLNITLRSILTGIPLRAFDIMGCGGFLISNFQEDFLDYFVPDEDFVYYESYEDLISKIDYYLEHDDEREAIAQNGYQKVKENHTYEKRVQEILAVIR